MDFMTALENNEKVYTENGAVGYKTSGHKLVDLNFKIPQFRQNIDYDLFDMCLKQDPNLTLRWLLYLRDIREGVGEREAFIIFCTYLCSKYPYTAFELIRIIDISKYGRYDDYIEIYFRIPDGHAKRLILSIIKTQLKRDLFSMKNKLSVSLLAKWMPSLHSGNVSSQRAKALCKDLCIKEKAYRKILSSLRKYIDVVEQKMCANEWDKIDYEKVPSCANLLYRNAFMAHDTERRIKYLESLKQGTSKINSQSLFLHDIVHKYVEKDMFCDNIKEEDDTLESLWRSQNKIEGFSNTLVVRDGSGSMYVGISPKSSITALDVADAITLYCAENNTGFYKNKFLTFSNKARIVDIQNYISLHDKLEYIRTNYTEMSNTNIENVFNLVLETAIKNNMSQEELPERILIISDMELDMVSDSDREKVLFEVISQRYKEKGYVLPKLVFWNVNSRTNVIPLTENENGVILISGFSKNLMKMVMSSKLDPYEALKDCLLVERYDYIDLIARPVEK